MLMKMMSGSRHGGVIPCTVVSLGVLCFVFATLVLQSHRPLSTLFPCTWTNCDMASHPCPAITPVSSLNYSNFKYSNQTNPISGEELVRALIDDYRERTRVAAASLGGNYSSWDGSLTAEQVAEWESQNPCRSRTELGPMYALRKHAKNLPPNPLWEEVFQEYSNYHRVCMTAVGDIAEYFKNRKTHTGCKFAIADTDSRVGIGNRLQVVANSIFYGIITRRVIVIPTSNLLSESLCEPIVGSTWMLNSETFPLPPQKHKKFWKLSKQVFKSIDKHQEICKKQQEKTGDPTVVVPPRNVPYGSGDKNWEKQPAQRFFCPTEQSFYSAITWVYFAGCLYTIPKTFANPTFRPTVEALFPDRVILTRLFRSFLLPTDPVWTRTKRLHDTYLQPADRRVGIQMRFELWGWKPYDEVHDMIDKRVVDCVSSHGILPELAPQGNQTKLWGTFPNTTRISVLVTSLHLGLHDDVKRMYVERPTVDGSLVNVVQLSHENQQEYGVAVDLQAYTEILLLSFSDDLMLTPVSTFGGSAQAYGALSPWFIEHRGDQELASCAHSPTVEVCNQYTGKHYDCGYDEELGTKLFTDVVPDIEDCPQIEFPYLSKNEQGIRIRTTFSS